MTHQHRVSYLTEGYDVIEKRGKENKREGGNMEGKMKVGWSCFSAQFRVGNVSPQIVMAGPSRDI